MQKTAKVTAVTSIIDLQCFKNFLYLIKCSLHVINTQL